MNSPIPSKEIMERLLRRFRQEVKVLSTPLALKERRKPGDTYFEKLPLRSAPAIDHSLDQPGNSRDSLENSDADDAPPIHLHTEFKIDRCSKQCTETASNKQFHGIEDLEQSLLPAIQRLAAAHDQKAINALVTGTSNGFATGASLTPADEGKVYGLAMEQGIIGHISPGVVVDDRGLVPLGPPFPCYTTEGLASEGDRIQVNGANQVGDTIRISVSGSGNAGRRIINKGNLIRICGVGATIPDAYEELRTGSKRRPAGRLCTFVAADDVTTDSSGEAEVRIAPALNDGSGSDGIKYIDDRGQAHAELGASKSYRAYQNVTVAPADGAVVDVLGQTYDGVSRSYRQSVFYGKEALRHVHANTAPQPTDGDFAEDPETGMALHYVRKNEGQTIRHACTICFGVKMIQPEHGIRVIGEEVPG